MKLRQTQKMAQILALTPEMRQSLHILQLPVLELKDFIKDQVEENPALEAKEKDRERSALTEKVESIINADRVPGTSFSADSDDDLEKKSEYQKTLITRPPTLGEHLLKQLRMLALDKRRQIIGEYIIGNIDENGYLNASLHEMTSGLNREKQDREKISGEEIKKMIEIIQSFDPCGVGARNLKECLLLQLKMDREYFSLAGKIVKNHLSELLKNNLPAIAKKMKISAAELKAAVSLISSLEPKPGRQFISGGENTIPNPVPDIILEKIEGKYEIIINNRDLPSLRISNFYLNLIKSDSADEKTKIYIQEKIKSALNLIKSIAQREETMRKMVRQLLEIQKDFFELGERTYLKPLTLKDIAKTIDRNESTVSRIVRRKYIKTPLGTYRLDFFFTKGLKTHSGAEVSQELIKTKIFNLVDDEPASAPLKDSDLAEALNSEGINIARRTVAKYREELNIPPYHRRKNK